MSVTFAYIARNQSGQQVTGRLAAPNEQGVLAELHARDLAPIQVTAVKESMQTARRLSTRRLATTYRQLADLLRAGVPLMRALRLLAKRRANPKLANIMRQVADAVADGATLADAMSTQGDVFPDMHVAMVRAGERGGFLDTVLGRMGEFLERQADIRSKVVGNLIYPFALLGVGATIIVGALYFFVPKFAAFYKSDELPLPTTILMAASDLVRERWWLLPVIAVVGFFAVQWARQQPAVRRWFAGMILKTPVLGSLIGGLAVSRLCRTLGTLLANGIPLLPALQVSRDAAGNVLLAEAIDHASESVRAGEPLATPLGSSGLLDDDVIEMIAVAESANNLQDVLVTIADTLDGRIERTLTVLIRLMEPALLLLLGGAVFFIFMALVIPMMQLSSKI
ncbi:MAG: type II secretion system F family protein [Planctomycetota bacterium]